MLHIYVCKYVCVCVYAVCIIKEGRRIDWTARLISTYLRQVVSLILVFRISNR